MNSSEAMGIAIRVLRDEGAFDLVGDRREAAAVLEALGGGGSVSLESAGSSGMHDQPGIKASVTALSGEEKAALEVAIDRLSDYDGDEGFARTLQAILSAQANVEEKKAFPFTKLVETLQWIRDDIERERGVCGAGGSSGRTFDHMAFIWENMLSEMIRRLCPLVEAERKEAKARPQEVAMVTCENCGEWTPPAFACIRCGLTCEKARIGGAERGEALTRWLQDGTEVEICSGCGHKLSLHYNDVTGMARCRWEQHGTSTSGIIGLPYTDICCCADFRIP